MSAIILSSRQRASTEAQLRRFPAINIEDSARTLTKRVARAQSRLVLSCLDMETKNRRSFGRRRYRFCPQPLCQTLIDKNELVSCTIPYDVRPHRCSPPHKFGGRQSGRRHCEIIYPTKTRNSRFFIHFQHGTLLKIKPLLRIGARKK